MKTLLFVQNGDDQPKCVPCSRLLAETLKRYGIHWSVVEYDRWWLVECENADAGRTLIYAAELVAAAKRFTGRKDAPACISGKLPEGRILASGGRHA